MPGRSSLSEEALTAEHRAAVAEVVKARMTELGLSQTALAELSGLSVNTVKGVIRPTGNPTKSTLGALAAVLGWAPQYLDDIAHGGVADNAPSDVLLDTLLVNLMSGLRADMAGLSESVHRVNEKTRTLIELLTRQASPHTRHEYNKPG
jgi:transcriptional regulator with XRE-family HTH domain